MPSLAEIARALPGVQQGVACAGTALESRTFQVQGKAFLFVSKEHARFKLGPSIGAARARGAQVGAGGWTKIALDALPPQTVLRTWIAESHGLIGGSAKPAKRPRR